MLPTEAGGSALGPRTLAAVIATLAEADASAAMVYLMHMSATATIVAARPGAMVAQTLNDISAGRHLTTLAFSEAGSRSHFWAPVSRAKRNGAGVHLTAKKSFVTSAGRLGPGA
jgi:alkylation response protein AidB-like acyl-CoA dehydrogenase